MPDLDQQLRAVARDLVAGAPAPPPLPAPVAPVPGHPRYRRALVAAAVVALVASVAVAVQGRAPETEVSTEPGTTTPPSTVAAPPPAPLCGSALPFRVTVEGAADEAVPGPPPGEEPAEPGQLVVHWTGDVGAVEVRWPGRPQPLYAEGPVEEPFIGSGRSVSAGRTEFNFVRPGTGPDFTGDVTLDEVGAFGPAPCDLIQLTVRSPIGVSRTGLRPAPESIGGLDLVNLSPRIRERRQGAGPLTAITCHVPPGSGMTPPPNRTSGPDATIRGDQPADVLLAWLATNPRVMPSGWVEFAQPDGTVTYAVEDPLAPGWVSILFVVPAGGGWQFGGSTGSGC